MNVGPVHAATLHAAPAGWRRQPPLPSHVPSKPHVEAGWLAHSAVAVPAGTGAHVPSMPGKLQAWHKAPQAEAQQTPSTQSVLSHSPPPAQV